MKFSKTTKDKAYKRSGGQCECERGDGLHPGHRCPERLKRHGEKINFNHLHADRLGGADEPSNCEVICRRCHKRTLTYGKH